MIQFNAITNNDVLGLTSVRKGEVKIGQCVKVYDDFESFGGKYVVIGVVESVGPQANLGFSGAENGFNSFLSRFLNIQSNRFLTGEEVLLYGAVSVVETDVVESKRSLVGELDEFLISHLIKIYSKGYLPILIGGGHNNAYPLIRSFYDVNKFPLNVVNCDPHADFRLLEGRHSGNSFSYAMADGSLKYYSVFGLHQSYNSEEMLQRMEREGCDFTFFDDYLVGNGELISDVDGFITKVKGDYFGVELDMDAIKGMPSSAYSFSGITVEEARNYVIRLSKESKVVYLHLPEGAPVTGREDVIVGKTLAYLVSDFIKNNK